jgi:hypothetical protein
MEAQAHSQPQYPNITKTIAIEIKVLQFLQRPPLIPTNPPPPSTPSPPTSPTLLPPTHQTQRFPRRWILGTDRSAEMGDADECEVIGAEVQMC